MHIQVIVPSLLGIFWLSKPTTLPPYRHSLAGSLLSAREAVMAPIRVVLRNADLSDQQWRVVRVLCDEGTLDAKTLAASALLHAPSVTRILRELEQRGLLTRTIDPQDARRQLIVATPASRALFESVTEITLGMLAEYSRRFGEKRLQRLIAELETLTEVLADFGTDDPQPVRALV